MEKIEDKFDTINITTYINELIIQTEVTQYFKNTTKYPIELQMTIPKLSNNNLTRFEMTTRNQKVISKLIEKGKAEEKYTDTIASGNYGFLSYSSKEETTICLGNIPPKKEITLKSYFFGHIISKDYSYQASFPVIFPGFILGDPKNKIEPKKYEYKKQIVEGKIYINTFSELTRLVIKDSNNFGKINKKYGKDYQSAEISIYKDNFSEKDISGIILFRTKNINKDQLFLQYDPNKNKNYFMLQKTLEIPEFNSSNKAPIDEDEAANYSSLLMNKEKKGKNNHKKCYIFLFDQSGSMSGTRIKLCSKALLLFLQSLDKDCFFQLIGFGTDYEYYTKEPSEYNKENISKLMDLIRNLNANKGGTNLYEPLSDIYNNPIYKKYEMIKHIFLLTDGEITNKEKTLNLIGSHSDEFNFHSIGIGWCDKDLIKKSALIGNGFSYFLEDLEKLNKVIISALEKSQTEITIICASNQISSIEDKKQKNINRNDFFRHGVILNDKIEQIYFLIKNNNKEETISSTKIELIKIPNGEELGKLIVDNYLVDNISLDFREKIKLSKAYSILCSETAFYAEIQNEIPVHEKMITITNKDKEAINNNINNNVESENSQESEIRNINYENSQFDMNSQENEIKENKKGFFSLVCSLFSCKKGKNKIINKKVFKKQEEKQAKKILSSNNILTSSTMNASGKKDLYEDLMKYNVSVDESNECSKKKKLKDKTSHKKKKNSQKDYFSQKRNYSNNYDYDESKDKNRDSNYKPIKKAIEIEDSKEEKLISEKYNLGQIDKCKEEKTIDYERMKKDFNFDEVILSQDILEGNWKKVDVCEILIEKEKDLYEKIKVFSENKGIKEEDGIITLFILYYIYNKERGKIEELKFVINKAKNYIKKIFNLEYDEIIKEFDLNNI